MVAMVGKIRGRGRDRRCERELCGLRVLSVSFFQPEDLSERQLSKHLRRFEQTLLRSGVDRVLLSPGFEHGERLAKLRPVDEAPMLRSFADRLALAWLERERIPRRGCCVALAGERLTPQLADAAVRLCPQIREIRLDVPGEESTRLARRLNWEFGVPIVPPTAPAGLTVAFGGTSPARLKLHGTAPQLDGLVLAAAGVHPPKELEMPVLALLWEGGRLERRQIYVRECAKSR